MIKLLITDLDNTLYDWVGSHVPAFNALLAAMAEELGQAEETLLPAFRRAHQRYHTTENVLAALELDVLPDEERAQPAAQFARYRAALDAFYQTRRRRLRLYDGVLKTLSGLRASGVRVVAHTDAMMYYASHRVCVLGLSELLDGLFAPETHDFPDGITPPDLDDFGPSRSWKGVVSVQEELPRDLLKPNPAVLWRILDRFAVAPEDAVYVGDSRSRDVLVAQRAGVHDVWAAYGSAYESELYQRLVEITHWTPADVERETELAKIRVTPHWEIADFREITAVIAEIDALSRPAERKAAC